jgi:hypothetical protein
MRETRSKREKKRRQQRAGEAIVELTEVRRQARAKDRGLG